MAFKDSGKDEMAEDQGEQEKSRFVFVCNLRNTNKSNLRKALERIGPVRSLRVKKRKQHIAWVEFEDCETAEIAVSWLDKSESEICLILPSTGVRTITFLPCHPNCEEVCRHGLPGGTLVIGPHAKIEELSSLFCERNYQNREVTELPWVSIADILDSKDDLYSLIPSIRDRFADATEEFLSPDKEHPVTLSNEFMTCLKTMSPELANLPSNYSILTSAQPQKRKNYKNKPHLADMIIQLTGGGKWDCPDRSTRECALRETLEETHISISKSFSDFEKQREIRETLNVEGIPYSLFAKDQKMTIFIVLLTEDVTSHDICMKE